MVPSGSHAATKAAYGLTAGISAFAAGPLFLGFAIVGLYSFSTVDMAGSNSEAVGGGGDCGGEGVRCCTCSCSGGDGEGGLTSFRSWGTFGDSLGLRTGAGAAETRVEAAFAAEMKAMIAGV